MSETEARLDRLERQVRRLRGLVVGVALALGVGLALVATTSPDELTVRRLSVVDDNEKSRFTVGTDSDGAAKMRIYDPNGKLRFAVGTDSDGAAGLTLYDSNEKTIWTKTSASNP